MTYNGTIMVRIPEWRTIVAAYGSTKKLNYAAGDQLPKPIAPPIMIIRWIFSLISGNAFNKIAKLVQAPVTAKEIG